MDPGRTAQLSLMDVLCEYRARIDVVLEQLEAAYGQVTYDRLMDSDLPLPGELGTLRFAFHGTGCSVGFEGDTLMWDWYPSGVLISDAWKLCQFTQGHPEHFGGWIEIERVKAGLRELIVQGQVQSVMESAYEYDFVLPSQRPA